MSKISEPDDARELVLRLGDDALILGQQLGAWVGHAPQLEEEMALANFALDYIGQARLFYGYAAELIGDVDEDRLAFRRDPLDYRNHLLVEQPNGSFADTVARQYLYEAYYHPYLAALGASTDPRLAEIAVKAEKELRYHLSHMRGWVLRLGDGTEHSRRLMQEALEALWRFTGELFTADALDEQALAAGWAPELTTVYRSWRNEIESGLAEATLTVPEDGWMAAGGKAGHHTEVFGYLLAEMQFMQKSYPGLEW